MPRLGLSLLLSLLAVVFGACEPTPALSTDLDVFTHDEEGASVAGAELRALGKTVGHTGEDGRSQLRMVSALGEKVAIYVQCPERFFSPSDPLTVQSIRQTVGSAPMRFDAGCVAREHSVIVLVSAERGGSRSVRYLGREVAKTDRDGAAVVVMRDVPGQRFELTIDNEEADELPRDPVGQFDTKNRDEVALFRVSFSRPQKSARKSRPRRPIEIR